MKRRKKSDLSRERVFSGYGFDIVKTKRIGKEPYYTVFRENTLKNAQYITRSLSNAKYYCIQHMKG